MTDRGGLARCREELAAARLLAEKGFEAQAVSRAYYAAFFAAETALLVRRVPPEEAEAAIRDAERVVGAVGTWLSRRGSP